MGKALTLGREAMDFSIEEIRQLTGGNAARLLGLDDAAHRSGSI